MLLSFFCDLLGVGDFGTYFSWDSDDSGFIGC